MKDFRHERVQNVLGFCLDFEGFPAIVSQLYAMGGLNDVLKKARTSPSLAAKLTWRQRLSMVGRASAPPRRRPPILSSPAIEPPPATAEPVRLTQPHPPPPARLAPRRRPTTSHRA
jgi:hypothetical protein